MLQQSISKLIKGGAVVALVVGSSWAIADPMMKNSGMEMKTMESKGDPMGHDMSMSSSKNATTMTDKSGEMMEKGGKGMMSDGMDKSGMMKKEMDMR